MIRRISALALGFAVSLLAVNALAQDDAGGGDEKGGDEKAGDAKGGGEAKTGGEASASATTTSLPESKGAFGKSGQIAISSDLSLAFESRSSKPPTGDSVKTTTIQIAPALDYFVVDNVSIGGQVSYTSIKRGDADAITALGVGPRVGYNLGLSDNISFWPKLGFTYQSVKVPAGTTTATETKMSVGVFAPILFHPAQHFFIGIGPKFDMDISSKVEGNDAPKDTAFGVASTVGGWF